MTTYWLKRLLYLSLIIFGLLLGAITALILTFTPNNNFFSETVDNYLNKYDGYLPELDSKDDYDYLIDVENSVQNPVIYNEFIDFSGGETNFIDKMTTYVSNYQSNLDGHTVNNYNPNNLGYFESKMTFYNNSDVALTFHYTIHFLRVDNFSFKISPKIEGETEELQSGETEIIIENTLDYLDEYPNSDDLSLFTVLPLFQFWVDDGEQPEEAENWKGARAGQQNDKVLINWRREFGTYANDDQENPPTDEDGFVSETENQLIYFYVMGSAFENNIVDTLETLYFTGKDTVGLVAKIFIYFVLGLVITMVSGVVIIFSLYIANSIKDYNWYKKIKLNADLIEEESKNDNEKDEDKPEYKKLKK